jgi:uncharacterized protein (DUF2141 family)
LRQVIQSRCGRRLAIALALTAGAVACASPGVPPGGPVDTIAPKLLSVVPDSGKTGITPKEVVFHFDKVVSERPSGVPSLSGLFLVSPQDGTPNVDWHRSSVTLSPHRAWRKNTVYTITMLPGITDLRGNISKTGKVTIFSTGADIPKGRISGVVFNWLSGNIAPRAFLEARATTDTTTVYVAAADSVGKFNFSYLSPGSYRVRAIIDENNNRGLDPRESWDTATVGLTDSASVQLYAFPHDSVGARLMSVGLRDSVTLELVFDHGMDVNQQVQASAIDIKTSDSAVVPIVSVSKPVVPPDTTAPGIIARPTRPIPATTLLVRIGLQIKQKTILRIRVSGIRGLDGVAANSERTVVLATTPPPTPTPPGAAPPSRPPPPPPPPKKGSISNNPRR